MVDDTVIFHVSIRIVISYSMIVKPGLLRKISVCQ